MGRPKKTDSQTMADAVEAETMGIVKQEIPGAKIEIPSIDSEYRIEVIKDYYGNVDPFYLPNKDPRYEYSFIRDDQKNLSMKTNNMLFQGGGWQLCDRNHLVRIGIGEKFISPDGLHRRGDLILGFIPKHLYQEKLADKARKSKSNEDAVEHRLKHGSVEGGGIHETMKGIQTQEQLGLK